MNDMRLSLALTICLCCYAASGTTHANSCAPIGLTNVAIGFSLNHLAVLNSECSGSDRATRSEDNILVHYGDSGIPQRVDSLLAEMKGKGAVVLREHLWFRHIEDTDYRLAQDPIGVLIAKGGRLPQSDIAHLVSIASNAKALGYKRYVIVFGVQGHGNVKCKKGSEWGGCYDERLDAVTWGVIKQSVVALSPLTAPTFDVAFDIAPESCPTGTTLLVDKEMAHYQRAMLSHYLNEFGDNHFLMSCGAGNALRAIPAIQAMVALYREFNVRPSSLDVHIYELNPKRILDILNTSNAAAIQIGVPFDINETYYDHPSLFSQIESLEASNRLTALRQILIFPLHTQSQCQIDVGAPYDIATIRMHLGQLSPSREIRPACDQ